MRRTRGSVPRSASARSRATRAGLAFGAWQVGPGLDLAQVGPGPWTLTTFVGGFVRIDL